jgi:hypothetical protein
MKKDTNDFEISKTEIGIPTPVDEENHAPTDMISEAVSEIVENVKQVFNMENDQMNRAEAVQGLSPNDQASSAIDMVYGQSLTSRSEDEVMNAESGIGMDEVSALEVSPVAEEGTPVDPVAPPTDIVNGTDLLNGYNGDDDRDK